MSSDQFMFSPHVFWFFGLSGAGKSTLGAKLAGELRAIGRPVLALDGDSLRSGLCAGLGYSDLDRTENLRRAAECAKLGLESEMCVVASFITPRQIHRDLVTKIIGRARLSWIFVDAPLEICRQRDRKGLYARASAGEIPQMTGLTSAFELPAEADLVVPSSKEDVTASAICVVSFGKARIAGKGTKG